VSSAEQVFVLLIYVGAFNGALLVAGGIAWLIERWMEQ